MTVARVESHLAIGRLSWAPEWARFISKYYKQLILRESFLDPNLQPHSSSRIQGVTKSGHFAIYNSGPRALHKTKLLAFTRYRHGPEIALLFKYCEECGDERKSRCEFRSSLVLRLLDFLSEHNYS